MESDEHDVIVIGSGMGGMTSAAFLAKTMNKRVLVLERHFVAGGQTHEFKRPGGFEWDVGLHYVGHMGEGQPGRKLTDFITDGAVDWRPLPDPYDVFVYPDFRFEVPFGEDRYREALTARFPHERGAIAQYFEDVGRTCRWMSVHMTRKAVPGWLGSLANLFSQNGGQLGLQTTKSYLDEHIGDPMLRTLLASQWGDYGLTPEESAFGQHALVVHSYLDGAYYPVGGAKSIARGVARVLESRGGQILVNREVTRILVEDGRAVGVEARCGKGPGAALEVYRAPVVISAVGAVPTYLRLLPEHIELPFRDQIRAFRHGHSAVTLYLGLSRSPESINVHGANYWLYTDTNHDQMRKRSERALFGDPPFAFVSFPSVKNPEARRHTAQVITVMDYEAFEPWQGSGWRDRPQEYEAAKATIARGLLELAEQHLPGLTALVEYQEVSTPLTLMHFTAHPFGAFYGVPSVPERYAQEWLDIATPIEGLYLTGEDVASLGIMGAAMGGVMTAARVIGGRGLPTVMRHLR